MTTNMIIEHLKTCECGVPDGYNDVENCGEPAVVRLRWGGSGDWLYVCEKHLCEIEEESEELNCPTFSDS